MKQRLFDRIVAALAGFGIAQMMGQGWLSGIFGRLLLGTSRLLDGASNVTENAGQYILYRNAEEAQQATILAYAQGAKHLGTYQQPDGTTKILWDTSNYTGQDLTAVPTDEQLSAFLDC